MEVYKFNFGSSIDWVCAKDLDEAIFYLEDEFGYDLTNLKQHDITICNIEKDKLWYGVDAEEIASFLCEYLHDNKVVEVKKDKRRVFDFVIRIPFARIIEWENINKPYMIASTEW